jgi:hypothetical protein
MVAPVPTIESNKRPRDMTNVSGGKIEGAVSIESVYIRQQQSEIPVPTPQLATSCPLTPVDPEQARPSSSCADDVNPGQEAPRSKTSEPERVIEWSPSQRYGKVTMKSNKHV